MATFKFLSRSSAWAAQHTAWAASQFDVTKSIPLSIISFKLLPIQPFSSTPFGYGSLLPWGYHSAAPPQTPHPKVATPTMNMPQGVSTTMPNSGLPHSHPCWSAFFPRNTGPKGLVRATCTWWRRIWWPLKTRLPSRWGPWIGWSREVYVGMGWYYSLGPSANPCCVSTHWVFHLSGCCLNFRHCSDNLLKLISHICIPPSGDYISFYCIILIFRKFSCDIFSRLYFLWFYLVISFYCIILNLWVVLYSTVPSLFILKVTLLWPLKMWPL